MPQAIVKRTPGIRIRPLRPDDLDPLYEMYVTLERLMPHKPRTRRQQFYRDLTASAFYRSQDLYEPAAEIALVAEQAGTPVAYADGCKRCGKFGWQAVLRLVIGRKDHEEALRLVIRSVVDHLISFHPEEIRAFSPSISPVFMGGMGRLSSSWAWLGSCLVSEGFKADAPECHLLRPLRGRGSIPRPGPSPDGLEVRHGPLPQTPQYGGIPTEFGFRKHIPGVAWCDSVYYGAFVKGSAYRCLYTNHLVVEKQCRRRGFARLLLRESLLEARKRGALWATLTTEVDNFAARDLYRSEGYRCIDTVCGFVRAGWR